MRGHNICLCRIYKKLSQFIIKYSLISRALYLYYHLQSLMHLMLICSIQGTFALYSEVQCTVNSRSLENVKAPSYIKE